MLAFLPLIHSIQLGQRFAFIIPLREYQPRLTLFRCPRLSYHG